MLVGRKGVAKSRRRRRRRQGVEKLGREMERKVTI